LNKNLLELFRQKNFWERSREKEIAIIQKSFVRGVVVFCISITLSCLVRMVIRGEDTKEYSFLFSLCSFSLFLLFAVFFWLYFRTVSYYQKKINKINRKVIEELSET
jgi:hypothetical protein